MERRSPERRRYRAWSGRPCRSGDRRSIGAGLDTASRTDGPRSDVVAIRADIAALEARLQRWVIGLAIAITALFLTLGGTVVGFIVAAQGQSREDFRAFQEAAAEDRRAMQSAIRALTDRTARTEERLDAGIPVQRLTPRAG